MQKRQEPHVRAVHQQRGGRSYRRDSVQLRGPSKQCGDCVLLEKYGVRVSGDCRCLVEKISNFFRTPLRRSNAQRVSKLIRMVQSRAGGLQRMFCQ